MSPLGPSVPLAEADGEALLCAADAGSKTLGTDLISRSISVAAQTETEEAEEEVRTELMAMHAQFVGMRRRCEKLEALVECDGAVVLRAFQRRDEQLQERERAVEALARRAVSVREGLVGLLCRAHASDLLRLCLHNLRMHALLGRELAKQAKATPPPAPAVLGSQSRPILPKAVERRDLYRMSYEALIDTVLEWQDATVGYSQRP
uniref:Uncharacterized protein n=1 Tax=Coccolithus braarudii TaxID=221442 RepID=A0A7S0LNK8_9EUKA